VDWGYVRQSEPQQNPAYGHSTWVADILATRAARERDREVKMSGFFLSLGVILTFLLGVWNIINNYRLSRRTVFINTVTAERVKWIEKVRDNISTFCGLAYTWQASALAGKPEELDVHKQFDKLRHLIRLQLNPSPDATLDREIERLIGHVPNLTDQTKATELAEALNQLVEVSQKLLKAEWDKVKEESKRGDLKDVEHCLAPMLRKLNAQCLKLTERWAAVA
jgi:hypothetical protein